MILYVLIINKKTPQKNQPKEPFSTLPNESKPFFSLIARESLSCYEAHSRRDKIDVFYKRSDV